MELRNQATGDVIQDYEFRELFKNTSFPADISSQTYESFGYDPVLKGPQPTLIPPYQYAQRDGVIEIDGQWFTHYIAVTPNDDQKAAMDAMQASTVRSERNRRLTACDWTQLPDAPVDRDVWAAYRQELRDVSSQTGFPWNVVWPSEPS